MVKGLTLMDPTAISVGMGYNYYGNSWECGYPQTVLIMFMDVGMREWGFQMPVISFIRAQKMQSAAQILLHTAKSIDEIAEDFGYENESKFSAAFKKIMGDTPSIYRKEHSKIKII